ncbi:MAG: methyltransferase domain-containing protein, partial [Paracoccaceae bacterium]
PDYPYFSSVSPALMAHFHASAQDIIAARNLRPADLVIEAASNDGYMLKTFAKHGIGVLGIDPADGPVAIARNNGIATKHDFFSAKLAGELVANGQRADVFLANNVLAHVADVHDFVTGVKTVLRTDGIAIFEFPYLLDLVDTCAFDTIYHQHLLYLTLSALMPLLAREGLFINDARRIDIHGGSLRVFVSKSAGQTGRLQNLLALETRRDVLSTQFYRDFLTRLKSVRSQTRAAVARLKSANKRVAAYGAAAKATTFLHHVGLDRQDIEFIVDKSTWKHGLNMPGNGIPIFAPGHLAHSGVDAVIILAWNFADEIIAENQAFLRAGGTFLVPIPEMRIIKSGPVGVPA